MVVSNRRCWIKSSFQPYLDTEGAPILRSNTNLLILPLLVSAAQP